MTFLRRRLASCAMAMLVSHSALLLLSPVSSCCPSRQAAAERAEAGKDCCPAGSHAPGQCPLHGRAKGATKSPCRMQCSAPHGVQFLAGASGTLPAPAASLEPPAMSLAVAVSGDDPETRPSVPDSPPPRLL